MKRLIKKTSGLIRGAPTAVVVSISIHLILFFVLGGIVVVKIAKEKAAAFKPPPPIDRPKMELKKPKVKVKKSAKPKASARIVSKSDLNLTDFSMPAVSSVGSGLSDGIGGGFEMMPDPSDMTLFGAKKSTSIGNDFEGTFYSLCLDRRGRDNGVGVTSAGPILRKFFDSGWNENTLAPYYRWPQKLYTTFIYIPTIGFDSVPLSFGIPHDVNTEQWVVLYKGKIRSKEGGRFRFWGMGNLILSVRVDGVEVGHLGLWATRESYTSWRSSAEESLVYFSGKLLMEVGDWFELEPDTPVNMEVLIGDLNGFDTQATLRVEKFGETYKKNRDGGPILPVFKTAEIPESLKDEIRYLTIAGDQDLDSDLIFNVY